MPKYFQDLLDAALKYAPQLALTIFLLFFGNWVINKLCKVLDSLMIKRKMDETVRSFLISFLNSGLKIMLLLSVARMLGVETTSFVAVLGAATFAIGMALQGSLGNFASGVLLLTFRPYRVGDVIQIDELTGKVDEIQIFNTIILTQDNRKIIIPNANVTSVPIINISTKGLIRVDMEFGISYSSSIDVARSAIQKVADANSKILKYPAIDIFVLLHGEYSLRLAVRPWTHPDHYWDVYFYMQEAVKRAFDENEIEIPILTE